MARRLWSVVLGLCAIVVQWWVVRSLGQPSGAIDPVALFFIRQIPAALVAALFISFSLPERYGKGLRGAFRGAFLHSFIVCLFLPVAGLALFLSLMLASLIYPPAAKQADFSQVESPQFVSYLISRVAHGAGARLRARVENKEGAADDRTAAMAAIRSLPTHVTGTLLSDLLSDSSEEIRLLAYGIVDGAERAVMQQIFAANTRLTDATTKKERSEAHGQLAELYWELIYQNLVQGAVRQFTLDRVADHAREALGEKGTDATMWYLLGRCALLKEKPDEAQACFERARDEHFPADRLAPWLAEAAYLRGQYDQLSAMLNPLDKGTMPPMLQPVVSYWSK